MKDDNDGRLIMTREEFWAWLGTCPGDWFQARNDERGTRIHFWVDEGEVEE